MYPFFVVTIISWENSKVKFMTPLHILYGLISIESSSYIKTMDAERGFLNAVYCYTSLDNKKPAKPFSLRVFVLY